MSLDFPIFEIIRRHEVPFVVIGGHAVNFHGHLRATEGSDLVWQRAAASQIRMFKALTELEANYIGKEIDPATGIERTYPVTESYVEVHRLMMLWTKFGFVDLFDCVPSRPEIGIESLFAESKQLDGYRFASRSHLVLMKESANRSKDRTDLENLPPES